MTSKETLADLLSTCMEEKGLDRPALLAALGFRNARKGESFLERIRRDEVKNVVHHRRELARALDVSPDRVDAAMEASRNRRACSLDAAWRASFRPHAVLTTVREVPQPIFAAALTGADRKLYMELPADIPEPGWPRHLADRLTEGLPGFGRVTGFVINYTPDRAVSWLSPARAAHGRPSLSFRLGS